MQNSWHIQNGISPQCIKREKTKKMLEITGESQLLPFEEKMNMYYFNVFRTWILEQSDL